MEMLPNYYGQGIDLITVTESNELGTITLDI